MYHNKDASYRYRAEVLIYQPPPLKAPARLKRGDENGVPWRDFHSKVAKQYTEHYHHIAVENLNIDRCTSLLTRFSLCDILPAVKP